MKLILSSTNIRKGRERQVNLNCVTYNCVFCFCQTRQHSGQGRKRVGRGLWDGGGKMGDGEDAILPGWFVRSLFMCFCRLCMKSHRPVSSWETAWHDCNAQLWAVIWARTLFKLIKHIQTRPFNISIGKFVNGKSNDTFCVYPQVSIIISSLVVLQYVWNNCFYRKRLYTACLQWLFACAITVEVVHTARKRIWRFWGNSADVT